MPKRAKATVSQHAETTSSKRKLGSAATDKKVGDRISVFWPLNKCSFNGTVIKLYENEVGFKSVKVKYDDGERHWAELVDAQWQCRWIYPLGEHSSDEERQPFAKLARREEDREGELDSKRNDAAHAKPYEAAAAKQSFQVIGKNIEADENTHVTTGVHCGAAAQPQHTLHQTAELEEDKIKYDAETRDLERRLRGARARLCATVHKLEEKEAENQQLERQVQELGSVDIADAETGQVISKMPSAERANAKKLESEIVKGREKKTEDSNAVSLDCCARAEYDPDAHEKGEGGEEKREGGGKRDEGMIFSSRSSAQSTAAATSARRDAANEKETKLSTKTESADVFSRTLKQEAERLQKELAETKKLLHNHERSFSVMEKRSTDELHLQQELLVSEHLATKASLRAALESVREKDVLIDQLKQKLMKADRLDGLRLARLKETEAEKKELKMQALANSAERDAARADAQSLASKLLAAQSIDTTDVETNKTTVFVPKRRRLNNEVEAVQGPGARLFVSLPVSRSVDPLVCMSTHPPAPHLPDHPTAQAPTFPVAWLVGCWSMPAGCRSFVDGGPAAVSAHPSEARETHCCRGKEGGCR